MKFPAFSILAGALFLSACTSQTHQHAAWSYSGQGAPQNWALLSAEYGSCNGKNQSPINITGTLHAGLHALTPRYATAAQDVRNNGHTVQIDFPPGSQLQVDGITFELKQAHLHAPSENHIQGQSFPLESHLVHADANGNLTVLAILYQEGAENAALSKFLNHSPKQAGGNAKLPMPVSAAEMLPANLGYYRFNGSLTTPPCSEGVRWLVLKQHLTASKSQIEAFTALMGGANNRPIQPLNARTVLD